MILNNQGLVFSVVGKIASADTFDEAVSFGQEGLIMAVDRFNPSLGYRFSTFAVPYIRGYILDRLHRRSRRNIGREISADFSGGDEFNSAPEPGDYREPERGFVQDEIWETLLRYVDPKRGQVIMEYYVNGLTLAEISQKVGLSRARVGQLISSGLQYILNRVPDLLDLLS